MPFEGGLLPSLGALRYPPAWVYVSMLLYLPLAVVIAWQWLSMAHTAEEKLKQDNGKKADKLFYEGKIHVARYFYAYELVKVKSLAMTLRQETIVTLAMPEDCFTD